MAMVRFLHILSVVSLAVLHASFDALPVNALAVEHGHLARGLGHAHAEIAMKRDSSKKCRPRPTSASPKAVAPTHSVSPSGSSQPATTTTSSQPPTYTPSSSSGGKILLGWSNNEETSVGNFITHEAQTIFNWALEAPSSYILGSSEAAYKSLTYVPSITNLAGARALANAIKGTKPRYIRGYNEPEITSQSNIPVEEAYTVWMQYVAPLANQGIQIMSPAVTTGDVGLGWLNNFMKMCNNKCGISLMDIHFYGVDPAEFKKAVNTVHTAYGLDIWVTEVGCQDYSGNNEYCDQSLFNAFYSGVMECVMTTPWIQKVAWFGLFRTDEMPNNVDVTNSMMDCPQGPGRNCVPNALGKTFINAGTSYNG